MCNTLRPGVSILCGGLQGDSLVLKRREPGGWLSSERDAFEGVPPRPYILDRGVLHVDMITTCA
jgi:hypothetical protein